MRAAPEAAEPAADTIRSEVRVGEETQANHIVDYAKVRVCLTLFYGQVRPHQVKFGGGKKTSSKRYT